MNNRKLLPDRMMTGFLTGLILPLLVFLIVWLVGGKGISLGEWLKTIADKDIITHFVSLCVFPNVFAFLLFNRLDRLYSARGVLGMTIIWALLVFIIKFS